MIDESAIVRANEWKRLFEEDGGIKDMFEHIRMEYFKRAGQLDPWEGEKLGKLAMAGRIVDMVESHVRSIIENGSIAEGDLIRAEKIAELPLHKRKWLSR